MKSTHHAIDADKTVVTALGIAVILVAGFAYLVISGNSVQTTTVSNNKSNTLTVSTIKFASIENCTYVMTIVKNDGAMMVPYTSTTTTSYSVTTTGSTTTGAIVTTTTSLMDIMSTTTTGKTTTIWAAVAYQGEPYTVSCTYVK